MIKIIPDTEDLIHNTHQNMNKMRKLVFVIEEQMEAPKVIEFITDRTAEWTIEQYGRNRLPLKMELIRDEETEEEKPISREVDLGLYNVVG